MDRALALTRARGDTQTTTLYEQQRAFYAAGGRVAAATASRVAELASSATLAHSI